MIQPYEVQKLIKVARSAKQDQQDAMRKSGKSQGTQMDLFVNLSFKQEELRAVQRLNLKTNNSMVYHHVYDKKLQREPYILESMLE